DVAIPRLHRPTGSHRVAARLTPAAARARLSFVRRWTAGSTVGACALGILLAGACGGDKPAKAVGPGSSTSAPVENSSAPKASTTTNAPTTTIGVTPSSNVTVADAAPPPDVVAPGAMWVRITRADGKTQLAAVYTP